MEYPPDRTMETLCCFMDGKEIIIHNDEKIYIEVDGKFWEARPEEIDELDRRGWICLKDENSVGVTDAGYHWANRWKKKIYQEAKRRLRDGR